MPNPVGPFETPPRPPLAMSKEAKKEWTRAATYLTDRKLLHSADTPMLEALASAVVEHRRLAAAMGSIDPLDERYDQLFKQVNQVASLVNRLSTAMCLTPGSRVKVNQKVKDAPGSVKEEQEWGRALRRVK